MLTKQRLTEYQTCVITTAIMKFILHSSVGLDNENIVSPLDYKGNKIYLEVVVSKNTEYKKINSTTVQCKKKGENISLLFMNYIHNLEL